MHTPFLLSPYHYIKILIHNIIHNIYHYHSYAFSQYPLNLIVVLLLRSWYAK